MFLSYFNSCKSRADIHDTVSSSCSKMFRSQHPLMSGPKIQNISRHSLQAALRPIKKKKNPKIPHLTKRTRQNKGINQTPFLPVSWSLWQKLGTSQENGCRSDSTWSLISEIFRPTIASIFSAVNPSTSVKVQRESFKCCKSNIL